MSCPVPKTNAAQIVEGNSCGGSWANSVYPEDEPEHVNRYLDYFVDIPDRDLLKLYSHPAIRAAPLSTSR
jgi:hypothetical protein